MIYIKTYISSQPQFESDLSDELIQLYRYFLKEKPTLINTRHSILTPGMIAITISASRVIASICLYPVEELLAKERRKKTQKKRLALIKKKRHG